jgi:hypothetical protein
MLGQERNLVRLTELVVHTVFLFSGWSEDDRQRDPQSSLWMHLSVSRYIYVFTAIDISPQLILQENFRPSWIS